MKTIHDHIDELEETLKSIPDNVLTTLLQTMQLKRLEDWYAQPNPGKQMDRMLQDELAKPLSQYPPSSQS